MPLNIQQHMERGKEGGGGREGREATKNQVDPIWREGGGAGLVGDPLGWCAYRQRRLFIESSLMEMAGYG